MNVRFYAEWQIYSQIWNDDVAISPFYMPFTTEKNLF